jgi:hypothetical protein
MAYVPGEEDIESVDADEGLVDAVYKDLITLGSRNPQWDQLWGSTRFGSHGYITGFNALPDISVLQVKYPEIEFKITPEPTELGFHTDDQFGEGITVTWRIKGSKGWHLG